jgi:hypothetical protein
VKRLVQLVRENPMSTADRWMCRLQSVAMAICGALLTVGLTPHTWAEWAIFVFGGFAYLLSFSMWLLADIAGTDA